MIKYPLTNSKFILFLTNSILDKSNFFVKLNIDTIENNTKAIPNTYVQIKYSTDKIFLFTPEIITTANEDAHGIKPVKIPIVKGFLIFELGN